MFCAAETGIAAPATQAPAPPPEASEGVQELGKLLLEVKALAMRLRQLSSPGPEANGIPSTGRQILRLLAQHGPQSVPQMARRRCTSRQNIQVLVNRLVREGCVELAGNPAHKRSSLFLLTERGRDVLAASTVQEDGLLTLAAYFSIQELQSASRLLQQLRQRLGPEFPVPKLAQASQTPKNPVPEGKLVEHLEIREAGPAGEPPEELPVSLL